MLPEVAQLQISPQEERTTDLGKTFKYDFAAKDFLIIDGKLIEVQGLEAIKVWVEKLLRTEKFRFKVYERNDGQEEYGVTLEDLIGTVLPKTFVNSELKREISQALVKHPRIASVSNMTFEQNEALVKVSFKINLVDTQSIYQEVIF